MTALDGPWTLHGDALDGPVPATVPGCVHTDLLAAGLIDDPFLGENEPKTAWIGRSTWAYQLDFDWSDAGDQRADLVCAGLDTIATVTLNGVTLGDTRNMHRSYRFDAREALREGGNRLEVRFADVYQYTDELREQLGDRPNSYPEPFNFVRKMACNFGWDWGPTLVTAGIWRPIGLETWSVARLAEVRPLVTLRDGMGVVEVHVRAERASSAPLTVTAAVGEHRAEVQLIDSDQGLVRLEVPDPARWWPRGYGEPTLHDLTVTLTDGDRELDVWQRRIGFRDIRLDTAPDEAGSAFTLVVNDVPVFVRGVNWIPEDAFITRVDRSRYADRLADACAANVNLIRVWGGGIYESEDFYDLCDELGLLVEQDFLFACAAYPEEQPLWSEVEAEAREQVARLTPHPSLVMWVGNNENVWGWRDWGWQADLGDRTWGSGYYFELLPSIVAELDPTRPYWPASPYSGGPFTGAADRHPNDPAYGSTHIWDVWNTHDYTHYRSYKPRFVAEFGFQAPAAYSTLDRAQALDGPALAAHQKAGGGDGKLQRALDEHFGDVEGFDDWHYLTQVNQARAIQLGVEWFRSLRPHCMGAIVWQLNDCWPVISWSAVDGDGQRKPLWHALRRAYADRLLTFQPGVLAAVNESAEDWAVQLPVRRMSLAGEELAAAEVDVVVPARGAVTIPLADSVGEPGLDECLVAGNAWWFSGRDKDLAYPAAAYEATASRVEDDVLVTVIAETFLRDLCLFADRVHPAATVDEQLVTLLPGDSFTFRVSGLPLDAPVDELTAAPVLRCVNDRVG
ncbi:glycoside hydrolase family 2 TIM barrel-domain containing protein [Hamadaea sp. NPDC051192]|uniref:glycoside hydrolase family 2 protein n=1 Tax=Hamadaea sp. NPDC051192 TaxID=3154940 RepID=UPI003416C1AB